MLHAHCKWQNLHRLHLLRMTLREYFEHIAHWPPTPIKIAEGVYVAEPEKMVKRHIAYIEYYGTSGLGAPYMQRLKQLKTVIENTKTPKPWQEKNETRSPP